jgi:hypothetical protein
MINLNFISDPAHGWLEVPNKLYKQSGIVATRCSYFSSSRNMVYLEEDCDASAFNSAMKAKGLDYTLNHDHYTGTPSWVRNLSRMPGV